MRDSDRLGRSRMGEEKEERSPEREGRRRVYRSFNGERGRRSVRGEWKEGCATPNFRLGLEHINL